VERETPRRPQIVLVPWDGSAEARAALVEASQLAAGGTVVLVHSLGRGSRSVAGLEKTRENLRETVRELVHEDLEVRIVLAAGDPLTAILEAIEGENATLAVVGTRGRSRLASRSLAVGLLRSAPIPVVITRVRPLEEEELPTKKRVIAGVDFSPASVRAAEVAAEIALERGAHLTLLHVITVTSTAEPAVLRNDLERLARKLPVPAGERSCFVFDGDAADALVDETEGDPNAWIVVGTRRRGTVRRSLLGSVAEEVLRRAPGPVVVTQEPGRSTRLRLVFNAAPPP